MCIQLNSKKKKKEKKNRRFCLVSTKKTTHTIDYRRLRKGKAASNKAPALTKSMNMDIWVAGISKQVAKVHFLLPILS